MKDLVISSKTIKRELFVLLSCFIVAFLINIASIIIYKTSWVEIFTQLGYVVVIAIVLYLLSGAVRLLIYLIKRAFRKK